MPGATFTPEAIDGLGFATVAFVGLAVGASDASWLWVRSTICRINSIPFPVAAFASAAVRPGRAARGMRISFVVISNV